MRVWSATAAHASAETAENSRETEPIIRSSAFSPTTGPLSMHHHTIPIVRRGCGTIRDEHGARNTVLIVLTILDTSFSPPSAAASNRCVYNCMARPAEGWYWDSDTGRSLPIFT